MRFRKQQGIAMVEFAIVLPLLLLLMFAAAEFGRALFQYNTLLKAVRDGGRYMAQNAFFGDGAQINKAAQIDAKNLVVYGAIGKTACDKHGPCNDLPGFQPTPTNPKITDPTIVDGNYYVTVSATYDFSFIPGNPLAGIIGWFGGSLADTIPLRAAITMRVL